MSSSPSTRYPRLIPLAHTATQHHLSSVSLVLVKSYRCFSADEKSKNDHMLAPEIVRAFTELFLTVENQAVVSPLSWNNLAP